MTGRLLHGFVILLTAVVAFAAGGLVSSADDAIPTGVVTQEQSAAEENEWGTFYTYYAGESYGTTDVLVGVAVIKPQWEIHPPHTHAEEEYLMVMEGEGTWFVGDEVFPAKAGDILYAAPWDAHSVRNTGTTPLKFVVWKWNNKGYAAPELESSDG